MPRIDWLLFDVGGVLEVVDDDWLIRFRERCAMRLGMTTEQLDARLDAAGLPDITVLPDREEQYWRGFGEAIGAAPAALAAIRSDFWDAYCGIPDEALLQEARSLVGRVGLAILSNSADGARREEERRSGFAAVFEPIVYSHEIGVKKPDPRAFEIALAAMGAPPERVLLLDDVAENVAAARGLGLHAHRHTDTVETLAILRSAAGSA